MVSSGRFVPAVIVSVFLAAVPAHGQTALRLRVGAGLLSPMDRHASVDPPGTEIAVDRSPVIALDVIAAQRCCTEWFVSGLISTGITLQQSFGGQAGSQGTVSPTGLHAGVNRRWWRGDRGSIWAGILVGGYFPDLMNPPSNVTSQDFRFRFNGGWGFGGLASYRHRLTDSVSLDANIRWHQARVSVGNESLSFSPYIVTVGFITRVPDGR
jgi:hypothetical protein